MHNGQPTGAQSAETTEEGAYTLLGATSGIGYSKNTDATWWIPSEDEWYKAAYFSPALGETGGYWLFPTQSDTQPNSRNGSPDDANSANYGYDDGLSNGFNGGFAVTDFPDWDPGQNYLTSVGSFFSAGSTYQTFDQGGNLAEWTDGRSGNLRNYRGGSWEDFAESLASGNPLLAYPQDEGAFLGFRLATVSVPEPSAAFLIALVAIGVGFIRKQP
jgi:formylglycine-generating enzyme required for sulfatase activity